MKLTRFVHAGATHVGVLSSGGVVPVQEINAKRGTQVRNNLLAMIEHEACFVYVPPGRRDRSTSASYFERRGCGRRIGRHHRKTCRFVSPDQIREVIFDYTATLCVTALDVLHKNPRYLTRAKSIDTFFSFGPVIVTADVLARFRPQHARTPV